MIGKKFFLKRWIYYVSKWTKNNLYNSHALCQIKWGWKQDLEQNIFQKLISNPCFIKRCKLFSLEMISKTLNHFLKRASRGPESYSNSNTNGNWGAKNAVSNNCLQNLRYVWKECCKGQLPDRLQKRKEHAATSVKEHLSSICDFLSFLQMDKWKLYRQGDNNWWYHKFETYNNLLEMNV